MANNIFTLRCTGGLVHEETETITCGERVDFFQVRYRHKRPAVLTCLWCVALSNRFHENPAFSSNPRV